MLAELRVEELEYAELAQLVERRRAFARGGEDLGERVVGGRDEFGRWYELGDERDASAPLGERVLVDEALDARGDRLLREHVGGGAVRLGRAAGLVDREPVVGHLDDALDALLRRVPHELVALGDAIEIEVE